MLNLDTHILLGALADELSRRERELLAREPWSVAAIVLWEIGKLAELGRIAVDLDDGEFIRTLGRIHVWPLTLDVCRAIRTLDFRGDPADELIAATSVVHRVPLVTRDARLRRSRRVPLAR
ncbi:MAG TPA: PIN domain-containing protein [Candidatus Bathyarchaeia archaeon]|nr:PIN domain-containing protein [Candidatus Bathyarchaeia archaeon]